MCGIAGYYKLGTHAGEVEQLTALLKHRGPDDQRAYQHRDVGLVHTRLSIIDLSEGGAQPARYDGLVMIFNGAIYNYKEIREQLRALGYTFESTSDTEVLLKSFHCWREQCVDRLVGMFAFVVYDEREDEIFLFRDRLGVKPLYFNLSGGTLCFASELKAWKAFGVETKLNLEALAYYFRFGYVPKAMSIYSNVSKLRAGHYLHISKTGAKEVRYWNCPTETDPAPSEEQWLDKLEAMMISAFRYRMESDVPVGVFLSGGIDSSLLAAMLQKHAGGINTFTIGFHEKQFDESEIAARIAARIGTRHVSKKLAAKEAHSLLADFYSIYDEPFADTSGIPVACVTQLAKAHGMKVVLSADGGDELFGGYPHYQRTAKLRQRMAALPGSIRKTMSGGLHVAAPASLRKYVKMFNFDHRVSAFDELLTANDGYAFFESVLGNQTLEEIGELLNGMSGIRMSELAASDNFINDMMHWDLHYYLPDDLLVKMDRATMYYGIEGREPFLDHRLVELAMRIPVALKIKDGVQKYILRKLLSRYLPDDLINPVKRGFSIPIFQWFTGELEQQFSSHLNSKHLDAVPFLNKSAVEREYKKYQAYKSSGKEYNIEKMWRLLSFMMWHEKWNS